MNGLYNRLPLTYFIPPEEKDNFILDKKSSGYLVQKVEWLPNRQLYEIAVLYLCHDLAD